jgi:hypothetical protein
LRSMPPLIKERLQAGATEGISRLQKNIERETGYVKRYQQFIKMLHGMAPKPNIDTGSRKNPNKELPN